MRVERFLRAGGVAASVGTGYVLLLAWYALLAHNLLGREPRTLLR